MSSEALATGSPVSISQMEMTVIQSGSRRPRNESHATRGGRPRGGLLAANLRR